MRQKIWLALRQSPTVRRLRMLPILGRLMRAISYLLLPSYSQCSVRVQDGPGKGLLLTLNPRWEAALWQGSYESSVQATLLSLLGPGKLLYDVGGGIGFYSLLAARSGARALVFEPDHYNAKCIQRNAEVNGLVSKIQIMETAAFSNTGSLPIEPALQHRGHGNAHVVTGQTASSSLPVVPCTRLDDFIRDHPVPDVVKIDVEGAESEVLKGAERLFADFRPHLICEVHDISNAQLIGQWLKKMGYSLRWLEAPASFPVQLISSPD